MIVHARPVVDVELMAIGSVKAERGRKLNLAMFDISNCEDRT